MDIKDIVKAAEEHLQALKDIKELEELRVKTFGKKSELAGLLKTLGSLSQEERPAAGQRMNEARVFLEKKFEEVKQRLSESEQQRKLSAEAIDITMPGRRKTVGHKHPMNIMIDDLKVLFVGMGFEIAEGPEIETDYYNFESLNIYAGHPAKDEQDTFYTEGGFVLRTQTSPVQVRTMEKTKPPIRVVSPGRVFRSDDVDATHSPTFHQCEGLVVDKGVTMGDLKGTLSIFAKEFFGADTRVRFRPHHFPFTEPSAEMDVSCYICGGKGCRVCKSSGWIELLGCGMVHPQVLRRCGIDPAVYSGFAFGMGLERTAMARYNIPDMRLMFENDIRFLKQF